MRDIVRYIIKTVQDEALLNGFQYIINYSTIEEEFNLKLDSSMINNVVEELERTEEVADVNYDDYGFDVVLYTNYATSYREEDFV